MGYQPNLNARNLKKGTAAQDLPQISVIMARADAPQEDPFFIQCLDVLSSELVGSGFRLGPTAGPESHLSPLPQADGYIVLGKCREDLLRMLEERTPNLVGLWRNPGALPVDQVVCSGQRAAALAMGHLVELGHRRIAYIGDCSYENRFVGYTEALTGHGLPLIYPLVFNVQQTRRGRPESHGGTAAGGGGHRRPVCQRRGGSGGPGGGPPHPKSGARCPPPSSPLTTSPRPGEPGSPRYISPGTTWRIWRCVCWRAPHGRRTPGTGRVWSCPAGWWSGTAVTVCSEPGTIFISLSF